MCQGQGQGIGGIWFRHFRQPQHPLNHFGDREFLRGAITDNGLLHFSRGHLIDFQSGLGDRGDGSAASLPHNQRGLQVLSVKESLDDAD